MAESDPIHYREAITPVPDPTKLTTEALLREISSLKELVFTRIEALEKIINIIREDLAAVPTERIKLIEQNRQIFEEKFASVEKRLSERDHRFDEAASSQKEALAAALSASEKIANKTNDAFAMAVDRSDKQAAKGLDQLNVLLQAMSTNVGIQFSDLKERLTKDEGRLEAMQAAMQAAQQATQITQTAHQGVRQLQQMTGGNIIAIISAVLVAISVTAAVLIAVVKGG